MVSGFNPLSSVNPVACCCRNVIAVGLCTSHWIWIYGCLHFSYSFNKELWIVGYCVFWSDRVGKKCLKPLSLVDLCSKVCKLDSAKLLKQIIEWDMSQCITRVVSVVDRRSYKHIIQSTLHGRKRHMQRLMQDQCENKWRWASRRQRQGFSANAAVYDRDFGEISR
jgi:hypothetical protein